MVTSSFDHSGVAGMLLKLISCEEMVESVKVVVDWCFSGTADVLISTIIGLCLLEGSRLRTRRNIWHVVYTDQHLYVKQT